jgi:ribonuclease BN (tRNA processing enzyme)
MRLTVLGGCGAWPAAGQACSGYLLECDDFRLLIDPGYATLPRLLELADAADIDSVLISHGHPDHCADLHPLMRARTYGGREVQRLPVYAPPGAVDRVVALDGPGSLQKSCVITEFVPGERFGIGPFQVDTWLLPHFVTNAGLRLTAGGQIVSYTGDTGPSPDVVKLAKDADAFIADATFPTHVPAHDAPYMSSAEQAGEYAAKAGADWLVLAHLWPGTDPQAAEDAARRSYPGPLAVARGGLVIDLSAQHG